MSKWLDGEVLFGLFMIIVFIAGAYDLLSVGGLSGLVQDSGVAFALAIIVFSVILLAVVILSSVTHSGLDTDTEADARLPFMTQRSVLIALVGFAYPVLFWAAEYLIATTVVGIIAVSLFTGEFGRKQAVIAISFTLLSYLLFFFLLGITENDGAVISTGLNDKMPTWRRDFFAAF
jgi:hypothetical protein